MTMASTHGFGVTRTLLAAWVILTLAMDRAASAEIDQCRPLEGNGRVGLSNARVSVAFDKGTGALVSLRNLATGDEYLKDHGGGGNPFRVYLAPASLPPIVEAGFPWHAPLLRDGDTLGGRALDAKDCRLTRSSFEHVDEAGVLRLVLTAAAEGLEFDLTVRLPDQDDAADFALTVHNTGGAARPMLVAFPYVTGAGLGENRQTNLAVGTSRSGTPGEPAWVDRFQEYGRMSGGVYGKHVIMQMISLYEPARNEGLGVIVMDKHLRNKVIHRFAPSGMSVLYFPTEELAPGGRAGYPEARVLVHQGNWRVAARRYGQWFSHAFALRKPPAWLRDVDLYAGLWIADPKSVAESKAKLTVAATAPAEQALLQDLPPDAPRPLVWPLGPRPAHFTSFKDLPLLYLGNQVDLIEWAMYWQGLVAGSHGADGTYHLRSDLGGASAMREGVRRAHAIGRRVMFYVASVSVRKDSDLFKGTSIEDWTCMEKLGRMFDIGYPDGVSMCFGYKPWQDHLAEVCRRILQETGADGIRLDEFGGPNYTCYNPAHHHRSPYDGVRWGLELLAKVRAAMDEVNPNAILMTESHCDFNQLHADAGGLQMFYPGKGEIDAIRVAVPEAIGAGYHPGAIEAALNGYPANRTDARRGSFPGGMEPKSYPKGSGAKLRWHELRSTFGQAQAGSMMTDADPTAPDDNEWVGRIWRAPTYWVLVGGHEDGTSLKGPTRVKLPDLPEGIGCAYEIDAQNLRVHQAALTRGANGVFVSVTSAFGAVLLPTGTCPPLAWIDDDVPVLQAGRSMELTVRAFSPWAGPVRQKVHIEAPGLEVTPDQADLPVHLKITAPPNVWSGQYYLRATGDCLPLRRWIEVRP